MKSTKIFISYAYDEVAKEVVRLQYFVEQLRKALKSSDFEIVVDYEQLRVGQDKRDFMHSQAKGCDVAIILLSPEYKRKVDNRNDGVFLEFNILHQRYLFHTSKRTYDQEFLLLPVTFIGNYKEVELEEIEALIARDFSRMYVTEEKGRPKVVPVTRAKYAPLFNELAQKISAIGTFKSKTFSNEKRRWFNILIQDTKSRFDNPENHVHIDQLFVRTTAYYEVRDGTVRFIIGRKGSGKSTITQVLPILESEMFDFEIPIYANEISLEPCYNIFSDAGRFRSDAGNVIPRNDALRYIWDVFFHLCFAYQFVIENIALWNDPEVKPVKNFIFKLLLWDKAHWNKEKTPNPGDYNSLFYHSFASFQQFLSKSIDLSLDHSATWAAEISQRLHVDRFREHVFLSPETLDAVYLCINLIKKKILLTFDGFDSAFELFRKDAIQANRGDIGDRADFESKWLFSMVSQIIDEGLSITHNNDLYAHLHYCITIPFDRYVEIREHDRDAYRTRRDFSPLRWSGIELTALIRKRLLKFLLVQGKPFRDDKELTLVGRLDAVLTAVSPDVPREIEIEYDGNRFTVPLFLYILRHSFWRPRDILYYFAHILAAFKVTGSRKSSLRLDDDFVKQLIKQATRGLIKDEFIGEFKDVCSNFSDVIELFDGSKQIIDFSEFYELTKGTPFQLVAAEYQCTDEHEKLEFLYRIGFLGVIAPEAIRLRNGLYKYSFTFNEDRVLTETITPKRYRECKFIIHPVFCEYLQLKLEDNPEFLLNFDWKYLNDNENRRGLGPT